MDIPFKYLGLSVRGNPNKSTYGRLSYLDYGLNYLNGKGDI